MFGRKSKKAPGTEIELYGDRSPASLVAHEVAACVTTSLVDPMDRARQALGLHTGTPTGRVRWFTALFDANWNILALDQLRLGDWVMVSGLPTLPTKMDTVAVRTGTVRWAATYAVGDNNVGKLVCVTDNVSCPPLVLDYSLDFDNNLHLPAW